MGIFDRKSTPPVTFADALMGELHWGVAEPMAAPRAELTEKAVVLESFTRFAAEKLAEVPVIQFEGGEILKKSDPSQEPLVPRFPNRQDWELAQAKKIGAAWERLTRGKNPRPLVLFIGETLYESEGDEFALCFAPGVAELFQKMVQAMKLAPSEYLLSTLKTLTEEKSADELLEEAYWWQPRFVVPLGAQAAQAFLGPRERLAAVHGKTFALPRLPSGAEVMPLFHPGVIATNANMKKATWTDMQKLMKLIGKA